MKMNSSEATTKKFYAARSELKRLTEICQKQHRQLKEYQKIVKNLESQLNRSKQTSPFSMPISPGSNLSPSFIQTTPTYKRPAKSTPYNQPYQSNLVTPARLSKHRSNPNSQRSNASNRISSTVSTPRTPESAGSIFYSQFSTESGYLSNNSMKSPAFSYCNGYAKKCSFKNRYK